MSASPTAIHPSLHETGRIWIFCAAALLAVLGSHRLPSSGVWVPFAIAAIAIAIWHGAFDGVLAEEALQPRYGSAWKPVFYLSYIALAAVVVLLWFLVPALALALFLLYSALHFGTESEPRLSPLRLLTGVATGLIPVVAACHWWPREVTAIFEQMLRGDVEHGTQITSLAGRILWPVVAIALAGTLQKRSHATASVVLIVTELLLFRGCSPLPAFAVFFCLWHTPEHMVSTSLDSRGLFQVPILTRHLQRGLAPWLISLAGMAVLGWYGRLTPQAYAGFLFIVLSALTVPHMMLAELCRRRQASASERKSTTYAFQSAVSRR